MAVSSLLMYLMLNVLVCFLLSRFIGGEEAVLVMWQLANQQSPTFLPRMGAPIESLAINLDAQLVAVAHSDNAIRLVDSSTFTVCCCFVFYLCVKQAFIT